MVLKVVNEKTDEVVVTEYEWQGELPRVGDVMEFHCGHEERWVVTEVDWVFAEVSESTHEEVPLHHTLIKVGPEAQSVPKSTHAAVSLTQEESKYCECGHHKDVHTPTMCRGEASTCQCRTFRPARAAAAG